MNIKSLYKKIIYGKEARQKLASGADKVAKAVISTLGPRSRNVAYFENYMPRVIHDGVSVAKQIFLKDQFENLGAQLIKEAASNTNDLAGDGTTTATLLANTLIQEGLQLVEAGVDKDGVIREKIEPMELRENLQKITEYILSELDKMSKKITTLEEKQAIAKISAQDEKIGSLVASVIEKLGSEGLLLVEEGTGFTDEVEYQEGMDFDNGYLSQYFFTDPDRLTAEYSSGYVLITDQVIVNPEQVTPIIEKVRRDNNKPLLIIADDVVGAAFNSLVLTKLKAGYPLIAVKAPEFAERRKQMLEDIAILTGGVVISPAIKKLEDVEIRDLGRFRRIFVDNFHTTITPENPDKEEIAARIVAIKEQIEHEENSFRKDRLQYRIAKLSQGVALIKVGGASEVEIKEKKEKFLDAIHALKSALTEGIIVGGGSALTNISYSIEKIDSYSSNFKDLVIKVLQSPLRVIISNSGIDYEKIKWETPDDSKTEDTVYDVVSKKIVDGFKAGIIDPVKVTKLAVRHAFSTAASVLTTDVLIVKEEEDDK